MQKGICFGKELMQKDNDIKCSNFFIIFTIFTLSFKAIFVNINYGNEQQERLFIRINKVRNPD